MADLIDYAASAPGGGGTGTKLFNALLIGGLAWLLFANRGPKDPLDPASYDGISGLGSRRRRRRRRRRR